MSDYGSKAEADAKETIANFEDEIVADFQTNGKASDDLLNDYPNGDSWHHENHVDKSYDLLESARLLDELSDHEETDDGLWQGCSPREAIAVQAAFTYGNAVYAEFKVLIERMNDDFDQWQRDSEEYGDKSDEEVDLWVRDWIKENT